MVRHRILGIMSDPADRLNAALEGRYRVERELGEGGMATVYLAKDLKHNRNVALKVLKQELAAVVGADRFLAEIETTANLQHPHILPLFDSGEADGFLFYVMPYVEGESLRQRLDREHQLPVDDAVRIATNVAEALDYAHRKSVIHRDIKPANVLLLEGKPVISDFGIALAVGAAGGGRLTETGMSLGTPHYMSPEQATGDQHVGPATDIYALGCVLYEMLAGEPPFTGSTAQAVLGRIITEPPPVTSKRRSTVTEHVEAVVTKALQKVPADRFASAQGMARALGDTTFRYGEVVSRQGSGREVQWRRLGLVMTAVSIVLGVALAWTLLTLRHQSEARFIVAERFPAPLRAHQMPQDVGIPSFVLSDDGALLVYRALGPDGPELFVRSWSGLDAVSLPGTINPINPTISPDADEVAFGAFASGSGVIRVAPLDGGPARDLRPVDNPFAHWGRDNWIYFPSDSGVTRIRPDGEDAQMVTRTDGSSPDGVYHIVWDVLPGGRGALMVADIGEVSEVRALDLVSGEMIPLTRGSFPSYAASGHVVYLSDSDSTIMAVPFDPDGLRLSGAPTRILGGVLYFSISDDGRLFYQAAARAPPLLGEFVWMSRDGQVSTVDPGWTFEPGTANAGWSLSPDGRRIAYRGIRDGQEDIWVKQLDDGPNSRLTFHSALERMPRWSADGAEVTFLSNRGGQLDVYRRAADGTADAELLFDHERSLAQGFLGPDGEWLVMRTRGAANVAGGRDILAIRPGIDEAPLELLAEAYDEAAPALSHDGRWLAYVSDETDTYEVFVRPFPEVESGKWQVSDAGGRQPIWSDEGDELFFINDAGEMVAAQVQAGEDAFRVVDRVVLFSIPQDILGRDLPYSGKYDVTLDAQRFIMVREVERDEAELVEPSDQWSLVLNFFEELKRLAPN
jgi:serine/threonine-protein kinase